MATHRYTPTRLGREGGPITAASVAVVLLLAASPSASMAAPPAQDDDREVNRLAAALVDFGERVEQYMERREDIVDDVGDAESTRDPAVIRAREAALAGRIRAMRSGAKHGDIFTPQIRAAFRRILSPHTTGAEGRELISTIQEDAPAPGAVPVEVNGTYPAGVPFSRTPPNVLGGLPPLPRGLEYRFVGRDLLLLDQPADVILDYIRNVVR
jgi:chorismate mutase